MADTNTNEPQAAEKPASLSAETPAAKPTATEQKPAPQTAATNKTVTKRKAAPKRATSTARKTTKKGTATMTTTTKRTATKRVAQNAKAANTKAANKAKTAAETLGNRFEKLTAAAQERAKQAADRAVKLSKDSVEFNRENIEALIESTKITARGAQEIGKTNLKYTRENFVEASRALQGVFSVATPRDFFEKQTDYLRTGIDRIMDQTSNNIDAVTKLAGQAYQPIADRVGTIRKEIKKAA